MNIQQDLVETLPGSFRNINLLGRDLENRAVSSSRAGPVKEKRRYAEYRETPGPALPSELFSFLG